MNNLTFKSIGSTTVQLSGGARLSQDELELYYSKNGGAWTSYYINSSGSGTIISLSDGDTVSFSGTNERFNHGSGYDRYFRFGGTGTLEVEGDLMSLINTPLDDSY